MSPPPRAAASTPPAAPRGVSLVKRTDQPPNRIAMTRYSQVFRQDGLMDVRLLSLIQITILGLAVLTVIFTANFSSVHYRLFPTTSQGKLVAVLPVNLPIPKETVVTWANTAALKVMSFGFHDFDIRTEKIRGLFTEDGWTSFQRSLRVPFNNHPNLLSTINNDRLTLSSTPFNAPVLYDQGLVSGVYHYRMRLSLNLMIRSQKYGGKEAISIDVDLERVPAEINSDGIAIANWQFARGQ